VDEDGSQCWRPGIGGWNDMYLVRELGKFAEEVRVSNVLRNRADREYLEERRRWYYTDRMANAKDSGEDLERYSV
jgi:hypothetical protein